MHERGGEQSQENAEEGRDKNKNNRKIIELASIPHAHIMQSAVSWKSGERERERERTDEHEEA